MTHDLNNQSARDLLVEFAQACSDAARIATWAEAFLQEGGEPTWDAVKSVSNIAARIAPMAHRVNSFADQYTDILP